MMTSQTASSGWQRRSRAISSMVRPGLGGATRRDGDVDVRHDTRTLS
jgi:hypothetical protein